MVFDMFELRRATLDDSLLLFEWRNDALTRENSINNDPVPWEKHSEWVAASLVNPARMLFIGVDQRPVGTSRLDRISDHLELSYTVSPQSRGQGYGHALVEGTLTHCAGPVRATVKPQNLASRAILERAGFALVGEEPGLLIYRLAV